MKYLQASKLVRETEFSSKSSLLLASSGQTENLDIYLRAEFALAGIDCEIAHLPFNTLEQALISARFEQDRRAVLLFPWDILPSLDWRTGIVASEPDIQACIDRIEGFVDLLRRAQACYCYLQAPVPPLFNDARQQRDIERRLLGAACETCAASIDASAFHLAAYLENGAPISGRHCGRIAATLVDLLLARKPAHRRVLVSDLDNVMWRGVIGEDGIGGIAYSPEGDGYPHYLYQGYLKKLEAAGVLIAAVSKNDADLARLPFVRGAMQLGIDDLVTVQASYYSKSAQIENIAQYLNLPLDAFVFVDDNPIELEQVGRALPAVEKLLFPDDAEALPFFFQRLAGYFDLRESTDEDRRRTAMYRTRLKAVAPSRGSDVELGDFLLELDMKIRIFDRGAGDNERALQLFNKTNQFNLNGRRLDRETLDARLAGGCRLFTAALSDRHGDHGEILACLLDPEFEIEMLVMSCRVFQRRVEHFFLAWLAAEILPDSRRELHLDYSPTERNTPFRMFLREIGIEAVAGRLAVGEPGLAAAVAASESLFALQVE